VSARRFGGDLYAVGVVMRKRRQGNRQCQNQGENTRLHLPSPYFYAPSGQTRPAGDPLYARCGLTVCPQIAFLLTSFFLTSWAFEFVGLLRSLEQITRLQRQLAVDLEHVHAAVDGVHIHQADGAGDRLHRLEQLLFRIHDDDFGAM